MSKRAGALLPSNLPDVLGHCSLALRVFAFGVVFFQGCPVWAESDVFMRMVGYALTGSDNSDTRAIGDRVNCVFAIKNELFRLNNVYADRINIRPFQPRRGDPGVWITLTLQGNGIVFEQTIEPPKDDGSEAMQRMRADNPDFFRTRHYT